MGFNRKENENLNNEIKRIEEALANTNPGTSEYNQLRETLTALEEIRTQRKTDPKVLAAIISGVGSLLGIVGIVLIENKGLIIRSKGFSLLPKGRG